MIEQLRQQVAALEARVVALEAERSVTWRRLADEVRKRMWQVYPDV